MRRIDYRIVKTIPIRRVLEEMYGLQLTEKMVTGELKLQGYCPICHSDKKQSGKKNQYQATIQSTKHPGTVNSFHCFACGAKGSIIDFVMAMEQVPFRKALELLHERFLNGQAKEKGPSPPPTMPQVERSEACAAPNTSITVNKTWVEVWGSPPKYHKFYKPCPYLEGRGIRPEVLEEFGVGYYENPNSKSVLNKHIIFPIHNISGELVAFAWRTITDEGQRYCFPPGERFNKGLELWNLHRALKEGSHVLAVEGFFSTMNLWQAGHKCVVALMGSNLSRGQCELLASEFETATFLLDPDPAGRQKLKGQVIEKLLPKMPVRIIEPDKQVDLMDGEEISLLLK